MRRKVGLQKSSAAAVLAADESQTHRLTDIEVKEVSVVDRPANRRKFLVVKREPEAATMKISPEAKTELENKIKGILEAAEAVSKSLETAEAAAGAPTPAELTAALETMGKLLGVGATATQAESQPTEKAKPTPPPKKDEDEGDPDTEEEDDEDEDEDEAKKKTKDSAKDVAKAGRKMARGRKERLAAAVTALKDLLSEVDDSDAPAAPKVETAKAAAPDTAVVSALRELSEHVAVITKAMSRQKERLDQLAKSTGGSRQVVTEKSDVAESSEVSWPLDMNKQPTRENTPLSKSFF
jgi:hypothetical protein